MGGSSCPVLSRLVLAFMGLGLEEGAVSYGGLSNYLDYFGGSLLYYDHSTMCPKRVKGSYNWGVGSRVYLEVHG